jgi:hypothetical protein
LVPRARWTIWRIWVSFCGDSGVRYMSFELERSAGTEDWTSHEPGKEGVVSICGAGYATVEVGGNRPVGSLERHLACDERKGETKEWEGGHPPPKERREEEGRGERLVRASSVHARKHADGAEAPPTSRKHRSQPEILVFLWNERR